MFKKIAAAALLMSGLLVGTAEAASTAVATANVNMRAGPSTTYPVVVVVPTSAAVVLYGCNANYSWCDVALGQARGWVAAPYLQIVYNGQPVVVTAGVARAVGLGVIAYNRAYWATHYAAYPWYGAYPPPPAGAAPPPPPAYGGPVATRTGSVNCANGACSGTRTTTGIYGGSTTATRDCANGTCTSTRNTTGAYGGTASRSRTCTYGSGCSASRTGPNGGTVNRSFGR